MYKSSQFTDSMYVCIHTRMPIYRSVISLLFGLSIKSAINVSLSADRTELALCASFKTLPAEEGIPVVKAPLSDPDPDSMLL